MDKKDITEKLNSSDSGRLVAKLKEEKPVGMGTRLLELLERTAKRIGSKYSCALTLAVLGCSEHEVHPHYEERVYIRRECGTTKAFYESPTPTARQYR